MPQPFQRFRLVNAESRQSNPAYDIVVGKTVSAKQYGGLFGLGGGPPVGNDPSVPPGRTCRRWGTPPCPPEHPDCVQPQIVTCLELDPLPVPPPTNTPPALVPQIYYDPQSWQQPYYQQPSPFGDPNVAPQPFPTQPLVTKRVVEVVAIAAAAALLWRLIGRRRG